MIRLNNGDLFNPYRNRSYGTLTPGEVHACQNYQIPLAYDPVQDGWVATTFVDDIDEPDEVRWTLDELRPALGEVLADLLVELEQGGLPHDEARERAMAAGVALCQQKLARTKLEPLDKCHIALHREIVRFLPEPDTVTAWGADTHVEYRQWRLDDAPAYQRILGNPKIWEHLPEDAPEQMSLDVAESMIELSNQGDHHTVQAVVRNDEIIGQVRLLHNRGYPDLRGAEVAYLLGEDHWGQGLMSNILADYTRHVFETQQLDFIKAWIHPDNLGSIKAATRAGYYRDNFPYEGYLSVLRARAGFQRYLSFNTEP